MTTWHTPITFSTGNPLGATSLNWMLGDNMNATAPALAANVASYFASNGANDISERKVQWAETNSSAAYSGSTYVAFADPSPGPSLTLEAGSHSGTFLAIWGVRAYNNTSGGGSFCAARTDNTVAADDWCVQNFGASTDLYRVFSFKLFTGQNHLTDNLVRLNYRTNGTGQGSWAQRVLIVLPF